MIYDEVRYKYIIYDDISTHESVRRAVAGPVLGEDSTVEFVSAPSTTHHHCTKFGPKQPSWSWQRRLDH